MTIRFKCPNAKCQKSLVVKDEQAGKRLRCPACKQPVSIPAQVSAPADLEAFAAAAFADEPAQKQAAAAAAPKQTRTIDFTCHYCDAELHLPAEEGGKNVACPECRKIIKVPALKAEKAKDWREVEKKGPSFARQDEPDKPAGAWDTKATTVGQEALEEAGVITEPEEPRTLKERLKPYLIVGGLVGLVVVLYFVSTSMLSRSAQKQALEAALASVDPKSGKTKLSGTLAGEVFRGAGEFHLRARAAEKAREAFISARASAQSKDKSSTTLDRDLMLTDIAINQTGLGGIGEEILGGKDRERLEWEEAGKEIDPTLRAITSKEAQAVALAEVCRRLLDRGQKPADVALGLANGLKINAKAVEEGGTPAPSPKDFARAQLVALLIATDKGKQAEELLPASSPLTPLAQAQGKALKGDFEGAKKEARKGKAEDQLRALLAVAAVALGRGKAKEAKPSLEEAFQVVGLHLKNKGKKLDPAFSFQVLQLARLMARAGLTDDAKTLAEGIPDKVARAHAHLELLLVKLAELAQSRTTAEPKLVEDMVKDKDTLAYALGQEAVARHNARLNQQSEVLDYLNSLEERFQPFAHVGIALGIQDRERPQ
jgi:DNA-directed RNA polymerase subunit RPC12/RpoP